MAFAPRAFGQVQRAWCFSCLHLLAQTSYDWTCVQVKHAGVAGRVQLMKEADSEVRKTVS